MSEAPTLKVETVEVGRVLTRTSGYLRTVSSHSLQPWRGCALGHSLCGVGCYVQHNVWLTRGAPWGSFLEARVNAAESYLRHHVSEAAWARRTSGRFGIFLSSSTEPFLPQEFRYGITRRVFEAMLHAPPDLLIVQTHSHRVVEYVELLSDLAERCELRVHISIESDRESFPGLPASASSVESRLGAAAELKSRGICPVVTVSPLLPIERPERFFERIACVADAVVLDHWILGDGSRDGSRTRKTRLPAVVESIDPAALSLDYRDAMVDVARRFLPGRVGVGIDGFAGRWTESGQRGEL